MLSGSMFINYNTVTDDVIFLVFLYGLSKASLRNEEAGHTSNTRFTVYILCQ